MFSEIIREVDPRVDIEIVDYVLSNYNNICLDKYGILDMFLQKKYFAYIFKNSIVIGAYLDSKIKILNILGSLDDAIEIIKYLSNNYTIYGFLYLIEEKYYSYFKIFKNPNLFVLEKNGN